MLITKLAGKVNKLIVNWPTLYLFTFVPNRMSTYYFLQISGLKITAGHRTMSGQNDDLSGQNFGSAVILTGHVHGFQINNTKKIIRSISVKS